MYLNEHKLYLEHKRFTLAFSKNEAGVFHGADGVFGTADPVHQRQYLCADLLQLVLKKSGCTESPEWRKNIQFRGVSVFDHSTAQHANGRVKVCYSWLGHSLQRTSSAHFSSS